MKLTRVASEMESLIAGAEERESGDLDNGAQDRAKRRTIDPDALAYLLSRALAVNARGWSPSPLRER